MKVRVLKELPFANIGDILNVESVEINIDYSSNLSSNRDLKHLIKIGWLEEVQEDKSLEDEIESLLNNTPSIASSLSISINIYELAKSHILERVEKKYNKLKLDPVRHEFMYEQIIDAIKTS